MFLKIKILNMIKTMNPIDKNNPWTDWDWNESEDELSGNSGELPSPHSVFPNITKSSESDLNNNNSLF